MGRGSPELLRSIGINVRSAAIPATPRTSPPIWKPAARWRTQRLDRRTTKLYDRTGDEITLDEVERITI
jgi:hypothetical protein